MKASEITIPYIREYLRIDEEEDDALIADMQKSAVSFMKNYTGMTTEQMDEHEEFFIAEMVLVQDMYDNRSMYVENSKANTVVETILGMHRTNLL